MTDTKDPPYSTNGVFQEWSLLRREPKCLTGFSVFALKSHRVLFEDAFVRVLE
jgi:hypothetical protein